MPKYNTSDTCHVFVVNDNIEAAIRLLKKQFNAAGIHAQLQLREDHPSRSSRRRAKALRALSRRRRALSMRVTP